MMPQGLQPPRQWARKTPVVLGILSIVFGSITAFFQLIGMLMSLVFGSLISSFMGSDLMKGTASSDPDAAKLFELLPRAMAATKPYVLAQGTVLALLSIGLIVVGIGLNKRRHWARRATLYWVAGAAFGIVVRIVTQAMMSARMHAIFGELVNQPAFKAQAASMQQDMTILSAIVIVITWGAYPTILAVLIGRPSAVADFESPTS